MKKWSYAIATDAIVFGCFYLWLSQGFAPAKSFLTFILWTFACIWIVGGLLVKEIKVGRPSPAYRLYTHATSAIQIGLCVWAGWVPLAIALFIGWMLIHATAKEKEEA